jgi:hypothetical protein
MPSAAEIDAKVDLAVAALESADYATALTYLFSAKALLSVKADSRNRNSELRYDRRAIDSLIADVRRQQNATNAASFGIQKTNVKYVATTDTP